MRSGRSGGTSSNRGVALFLVGLFVLGLVLWWQQREAPLVGPESAAIPGGSLVAHEGIGSSHTLKKHVGRTEKDLRERLRTEGLREASTFPDLATADRAILSVLQRRWPEVSAWLAASPQGNEAFRARLDEPVGRVLRERDSSSRPGRTVTVVLTPSNRFPEGFRIVTAYVSLP